MKKINILGFLLFLSLFSIECAFCMDNMDNNEELPAGVFEEDGVVFAGGQISSGRQGFNILVSKGLDSKEDLQQGQEDGFLVGEEVGIIDYTAVKEFDDLEGEKDKMTNFLKAQVREYIRIKNKKSLDEKFGKEVKEAKKGFEEDKK